MKGERMAKRSSAFGSIVKSRLSDITNPQSQHTLVGLDEKQPPIPNSTEDLINQLLKEKATLILFVVERDKIIALSDNQLRNLRMRYQKLQLQNWNLAQANSQMLALNLGREKLKSLQHELVCKVALLKAKNLEQEGKAEIINQKTGSQPGNRVRRRPARSQSMGPSTTSRQGMEKEKLESKRRCLRRQSARFKSQEQELSMENLFEIEEAKFPITHPLDNPMQEKGLKAQCPSSVMKEENFDPENEAQVAERSSLDRPVRRAVEKVQSYKEVPLNTKMRRTE
uniref:Shugoshin C-terminal domain-containing protein n=1 Tax=Manihot esculenta TaxID=3983 RepID=A0A2C9W004_MANES